MALQNVFPHPTNEDSVDIYEFVLFCFSDGYLSSSPLSAMFSRDTVAESTPPDKLSDPVLTPLEKHPWMR